MNSIYRVGGDAGYGFTKLVTGDKQIMFPSLVAPAWDLLFEDGSRIHGGQIGQWFVGDMARLHAEDAVLKSMHRDRSYEVLWALLMSGFVQLSIPTGSQIMLTTGLPSAWMRDAPRLKPLKGKHTFSVDGGDAISYEIVGLSVMPQPHGALNYLLRNETGAAQRNQFATGRWVVVDIGTHTMGLELWEDARRVDLGESASIRCGIADVIKAMPLDDELSHRQIGEVLAGSTEVFVNGKPRNYQSVLRSAVETVTPRVVEFVRGIPQLSAVQGILPSGGGGPLFVEHLVKHFPNQIQRDLLIDPVFANAAGFHRHALSLV